MFRVNRKFAFVVALAAALVMLFVLSSIAFAGSADRRSAWMAT